MDYPTEMPQTSSAERGFIVLTPTTARVISFPHMYVRVAD